MAASSSSARWSWREQSPWTRAFCEEWALPSSVMGPVERRALARLASICAGEVDGFMMMARLHFVPRRLKSSRRSNGAGRSG